MLTARTRRLRNTGVALLVIAGCVNYLDRAALAVGNPEIRHSLGLSYSQMGLLLSAFAWSYGLAQIPAGIAVDKYGARLALGAGMMLWSVAQIGAGFVTSLSQFIAARIALGLGESPMYIGGTRICADYFAAKDRALPIAIFNSSSALAPALAPPLLTLLMIAFGWQAMFIIAGLAGFAVAIAWVAIYRSPAAANMAASRRTVVVLPLLPVTSTVGTSCSAPHGTSSTAGSPSRGQRRLPDPAPMDTSASSSNNGRWWWSAATRKSTRAATRLPSISIGERAFSPLLAAACRPSGPHRLPPVPCTAARSK